MNVPKSDITNRYTLYNTFINTVTINKYKNIQTFDVNDITRILTTQMGYYAPKLTYQTKIVTELTKQKYIYKQDKSSENTSQNYKDIPEAFLPNKTANNWALRNVVMYLTATLKVKRNAINTIIQDIVYNGQVCCYLY